MVNNWSGASSIASRLFDAAALEEYLELIGNPLTLIRRGIPMIAPQPWTTGSRGIAQIFGLDKPSHCFSVSPHAWTRFHEPQITAGFAHFLNDGSHKVRRSRALALLRAAALCSDRKLDGIDSFDSLSVRCVAEENRTDILVEVRSGSKLIGASIEAKFGHQLTRGQLPKAYSHARDVCRWAMDQSIFLVVAPDASALNSAIMRQNKRFGWRAASWWTLLSHLEQQIDPAHDCPDYRRFRRTVWHRAY
ncbi:hypothetical protein [Sphingobium sp. YR657]|uniref:hypothetical protein n=1 Tax=Sphingobium sp. YR657 TaxID=1884366 RepID=UPI0011147DD8|nr:hypothetical protein [Sphingobium sp. YR657]